MKNKYKKLKYKKLCLKRREKSILFLCEGSQTLAQVAERGCGASTLGDTKNLTGHVALACGTLL